MQSDYAVRSAQADRFLGHTKDNARSFIFWAIVRVPARFIPQQSACAIRTHSCSKENSFAPDFHTDRPLKRDDHFTNGVMDQNGHTRSQRVGENCVPRLFRYPATSDPDSTSLIGFLPRADPPPPRLSACPMKRYPPGSTQAEKRLANACCVRKPPSFELDSTRLRRRNSTTSCSRFFMR